MKNNEELKSILKSTLVTYPDFPKPGIFFKDICPLLANPDLLAKVIEYFSVACVQQRVDAVLGIESRGFLFGVPLAQKLKLPFVPLRKKGKLPGPIFSQEYALEYGTDSLEIQRNDSLLHKNVVIIDDVMATGGTALASAKLAKQAGANVTLLSFFLELGFLGGRDPILGEFPELMIDSLLLEI
jgi:adenine phosphoribosyltransferase